MVPSPADIARYRHVAAAAVRGVGLLLFLYAATRVGFFVWSTSDEVMQALGGGTPRWNVERLVSSVSLQAVLLVFSVFAIGWPRVLARWLVPARARAACPVCGFSLSGLRSRTCPECGAALGSDFVEGSGGGPTGEGSKAGGSDSEEGPGRS